MAIRKCRWTSPDEWSEWSDWLSAGLHAHNRWRLPVLMLGILFAQGRRALFEVSLVALRPLIASEGTFGHTPTLASNTNLSPPPVETAPRFTLCVRHRKQSRLGQRGY